MQQTLHWPGILGKPYRKPSKQVYFFSEMAIFTRVMGVF